MSVVVWPLPGILLGNIKLMLTEACILNKPSTVVYSYMYSLLKQGAPPATKTSGPGIHRQVLERQELEEHHQANGALPRNDQLHDLHLLHLGQRRQQAAQARLSVFPLLGGLSNPLDRERAGGAVVEAIDKIFGLARWLLEDRVRKRGVSESPGSMHQSFPAVASSSGELLLTARIT